MFVKAQSSNWEAKRLALDLHGSRLSSRRSLSCWKLGDRGFLGFIGLIGFIGFRV